MFKKLQNTENRLQVAMIAIIIMALVVIGRLFVLMILQHGFYTALAVGSQEVFSELFPDRGTVYIQDSRTGEEYPVAMNRDFFIVFADTREIEDDDTAEEAASQLSQVFNYDDEQKFDLYLRLNKRDDPYEPIEQKVSEDVVEDIKNRNLAGIGFIRKPERVYPEDNLASHVIGFLGKTEEGLNVGRYGIEGYWQEDLAGSGGFFSGARSAAGRLIPLANISLKAPKDGSDILLTIDRTLQFKACERLRQGMEDYGAKSASLVIIEPFSGAVRAMCSLPDFNPNTYNEVESIQIYNNSSIFVAYEPGSIFKPVTMAAALNEDAVRPETRFNDTGSYDGGCKKEIKNAGNKKYDQQNMIGVLENSINTGMVYVAEQLGRQKLLDYIESFGFGIKEGIELDSEVAGNIEALHKNEDKDFDCYTSTASFGQGITATPLQMAVAFGAIANGGVLMKPFIVQEIRDANGKIKRTKPKEIRRVIDQRSASLLSGMLVNVVDSGQAGRSKVKGYYVAGKTGTAQIAGPGGYTEDTNHSFVGFAPVDDPKFVMIIKFEKPEELIYSASTAAPVFGDIAKFILQYYQVPPVR